MAGWFESDGLIVSNPAVVAGGCTVHALQISREGTLVPATLTFVSAGLADLESCRESFLHPNESVRLAQLKFDRRRWSFLVGRFAAKRALQSLLGLPEAPRIEIATGVFGQPVVHFPTSERVQISISHTDGCAAALAFPETHPMAIDLEKIDPDREDTIKSVMTEEEWRLGQALPYHSGECATLLWVCKESLGKALRTGMMCPLHFYELGAINQERGFDIAEFRYLPQYKAISFRRDLIRCAITLPRRSSWETSRESLLSAPEQSS